MRRTQRLHIGHFIAVFFFFGVLEAGVSVDMLADIVQAACESRASRERSASEELDIVFEKI